MISLMKGLRFTLRTLGKRPGFAATVVLILGMGIGVTTVLFSIVEAVLLRPLPYRDPAGLVTLWQNDLARGESHDVISIPDFYDLKEHQRVFTQLTPYGPYAWSLTAPGGEPQQVDGARVGYDFFSVLGVEPFLGRGFLPEEDRRGGVKAVILDYRFWRSRFGADRGILGKTVDLDEVPYKVIGILPPGFVSPTGLHEVCWVALQGDPVADAREIRLLRGFGRLRSGTTVEAADRELHQVMQVLDKQHPELNRGRSAYVIPLGEYRVRTVKGALLILFAAVGVVLLIAVSNVAGLLLARGVERRREIAIRLSLGATKARLIGLLVSEALTLALCGGAWGLLLAYFGVRFLPFLAPKDLPRLEEVSLNLPVVAFALGVALLSGFLASLGPALKASDLQVQGTLREDGLASTLSAKRQLLRQTLVIAEIALSVVLVIGAGLLVKSFTRLQAVDLGFEPDRLLTMDLGLPDSRYPHPGPQYPKWPQLATFQQRLLDQLRPLPGVQHAAIAINHPLKEGWQIPITFDDRPAPRVGEEPNLYLRPVSADYFQTCEITLLRGRFFDSHDERDAAPRVVIVNQALVRRYFTGDPIGKRLSFWGSSREIVGVVKSERFVKIGKDVPPAVYSPFLQTPVTWFSVLVRTAGDPAALLGSVRRAIWSIDPRLAIFDVHPMEDLVADSVAQPRFQVLLLMGFAFFALVLAMVGIYSLMAQSVAQRTAEIGVRIALGGHRGDIFRLMLGEGTRLLVAGLALGMIFSFAMTRFLSSLLYGVSSTDPLVFVVVIVLLAMAGLFACLVPALRSMRIDPITAMRYQ